MLLALAIMPFFMSCNNDEWTPSTVKEEPKTIKVSVGLDGEFISTSFTPFTRAETDKKKVYGINVYYRESSNRDYKHYAYGLFDNVQDMQISLPASYTYKFECSIVQDDLDEIYEDHGNLNRPFLSFSSNGYIGDTSLQNKFIVSTSSPIYFDNLKSGTTKVKKANGTLQLAGIPATDRLYGELEGYTPEVGGHALITMKRTAFGAKFILNPPTDGTLVVSTSFANMNITANEDPKTVESLYTFPEVYNCWKIERYTQTYDIKLTWKRKTGEIQEYSQKVTMRRNIMTTINVYFNNNNVKPENDTTIGISEDSMPTAGETINIILNDETPTDDNPSPEE